MKRILLAVLILVPLLLVGGTGPTELTFVVSSRNTKGAAVQIEGFTPRDAGQEIHGPYIVLKNVSRKQVRAVRLRVTSVAKHCGTGLLSKQLVEQGLQEVSLAPRQTVNSDKTLLSPSSLVVTARQFGVASIDVKVDVMEVIFEDGSKWNQEDPGVSLPFVPLEASSCSSEITNIQATAVVGKPKVQKAAAENSYTMKCTLEARLVRCPPTP
jgi:hypothetical protein